MAKRFINSDEKKAQVKKLASFGLTHREIGAILNVSADTIERHFKEELAAGKPQAIANVAQTLYKIAIGGNVAACIFWLKAQGKWKEITEEKNITVNLDNSKATLLKMLEKNNIENIDIQKDE